MSRLVPVLLVAGALAAPSAALAESRPDDLPPAGASAASANGRWLLGVRGDAGERAALAAGARSIGVPGTVTVPAGAARRVAGVLRAEGLLTWSQADVRLVRKSSIEGQEAAYPRAAVVNPGLHVPAIGPRIGVIDDAADGSHPDLAGIVTPLNDQPVVEAHGTEVASAAAGLRNGGGVVGIYPGAPILSWGLRPDLSCSDIARGIETARRAGAAVINLSLGSTSECQAITIAVQRAIADKRVVVAATGNEFAAGNPVIYPAASPHVLSVAAVDQAANPTSFSTANAAVDLAAPGVAIPVATPMALDTKDGVQDGITAADGTSFSAPIVAGMVAWLASVRPGLDALQYGDLLRQSAVDVGAKGYDRDTGYGVANLERALAAPTPARDLLEPNDGITYVDGTIFGAPDDAVSNGRTTTLTATADLVEDPVDVYRVRLPRGARMSALLRPTFGQVDMAVYDQTADVLDDRPIGTSTRSGSRTDIVRFVNRTRRTRTFYVAVAPSRRGSSLNARYRLQLKRAKR